MGRGPREGRGLAWAHTKVTQSLPLGASLGGGLQQEERVGRVSARAVAAGKGARSRFPAPSGLAPPPAPQPAPTHCQWTRRSDAARNQGQRPRRAGAEQAAAS